MRWLGAHRDLLDGEELWPAVVVGVSTALLVLGTAVPLSAESPTTHPNLQTAGLVLMLIGLTALVIVFTLRDRADRT